MIYRGGSLIHPGNAPGVRCRRAGRGAQGGSSGLSRQGTGDPVSGAGRVGGLAQTAQPHLILTTFRLKNIPQMQSADELALAARRLPLYNGRMYDAFSEDYDYFVNWPQRLEGELPFIERQLHRAAQSVSQAAARPVQSVRVLDAACGTGMHVIALAQRGFQADGADLSAGMIDKARRNAQAAGVTARFEPLGFGELAGAFQDYDALLCLGNSLPHILGADDLNKALLDFAAVLRPGGLLLIQNRNFDQVMMRQERWMGPETHRQGDEERIFVRFYDFDPDGKITFNILTLYRQGGGAWQQRVACTRLSPQLQSPLTQALERAGFENVIAYGGLAGMPFSPESSGNLVLTAIKAG